MQPQASLSLELRGSMDVTVLGFFFNKFIYLFLAALGSRCCMRASHCGGLSCCRAWVLGTWASVAVAHGLSSCGSWAPERRLSSCAHGSSCSTACGILLDQGSNPCPLHWQADSQPLRHQGSPGCNCFNLGTVSGRSGSFSCVKAHALASAFV